MSLRWLTTYLTTTMTDFAMKVICTTLVLHGEMLPKRVNVPSTLVFLVSSFLIFLLSNSKT